MSGGKNPDPCEPVSPKPTAIRNSSRRNNPSRHTDGRTRYIRGIISKGTAAGAEIQADMDAAKMTEIDADAIRNVPIWKNRKYDHHSRNYSTDEKDKSRRSKDGFSTGRVVLVDHFSYLSARTNETADDPTALVTSSTENHPTIPELIGVRILIRLPT